MTLVTSPLPESLEKVSVALRVCLISVAHGLIANIQCNADGVSGILEIRSSLHDVLLSQIKSSWRVNLLKASLEEPIVIVLPFQKSRNLVHKFGARHVFAMLDDGALIAFLVDWYISFNHQSSSRVASLLCSLASDYIHD